MSKNHRYIILSLLVLGGIAGAVFLLVGRSFAVLNPAGVIASQQRNLLIFATLLMLLIVLPVFGLTFFIAWRYRASNAHGAAKYHPEWDHNAKLETLWWGLPCLIILVLAIVAWNSSHSLDPYKPLQSTQAPLTIQVVALQWKWLFLYPEQQIASLNYVEFPANTPINFEITSDAPMNSFWIPRLGGQVYAMAGMNTQLHLMASQPGIFQGSSANLSGSGFANMKFTAHASTANDFGDWVRNTKTSQGDLSLSSYEELARPAVAQTPKQFGSYDPSLYNTVIMKYMPANHDSMGAMQHE